MQALISSRIFSQALVISLATKNSKTRYANGDEELYDESKDVNEWTNLATKPEFAAKKAELAALRPRVAAGSLAIEAVCERFGLAPAYDTLVRLGQDFSRPVTLIDPQGNFGSLDDPPAAYRYTECRLTPLAMQLLADIDEDTVDFSPTYDDKHQEPRVLPARFPALLVNGSAGIAVVAVATTHPASELTLANAVFANVAAIFHVLRAAA